MIFFRKKNIVTLTAIILIAALPLNILSRGGGGHGGGRGGGGGMRGGGGGMRGGGGGMRGGGGRGGGGGMRGGGGRGGRAMGARTGGGHSRGSHSMSGRGGSRIGHSGSHHNRQAHHGWHGNRGYGYGRYGWGAGFYGWGAWPFLWAGLPFMYGAWSLSNPVYPTTVVNINQSETLQNANDDSQELVNDPSEKIHNDNLDSAGKSYWEIHNLMKDVTIQVTNQKGQTVMIAPGANNPNTPGIQLDHNDGFNFTVAAPNASPVQFNSTQHRIFIGLDDKGVVVMYNATE